MIRAGFALGLALCLGACASSLDEAGLEPDFPIPATYAADLPPSGVEEEWWAGFSDPVLDALIERGLAANLDVDIARDRLRSAAAILTAERSDRRPSVDGSAEGGVEIGDGGAELTGLGALFGSFNPDISGRLRAEVRIAIADYAEADYLVADRRRLVAAAIATQYIEYRRAGAQLELLEQSTALQERTLDTVRLRFEAGLAANLDVRRAAADLAQTQARLGLITISRERARNALAVLEGALPGQFEIPAATSDDRIPDYAGGPPAGTPADLLRRRTDLLAAEARLARSAAQVAAERADLRPDLTLPANLAVGDGTFSGLFANFLASIGAALDIPIFDGGRRRAEIVAARAEADARLTEYRATFLDALAEVENALVAVQAFRQRTDALELAIEESSTALEQSNALFREGLASLFDLLDAQRQLIASQQAQIDSEADLAGAIIAFHAAVGSPGYARENAPVVADPVLPAMP